MTEPRDIEKDKAMLEEFADYGPLTDPEEMASYYIAKYEFVAAELDKYHKLHDEGYNEMRILIGQYEAQQARISELEEERAIYSKAVLTYSDMIITDSEDHPQDVGEVARNALEEISLIRLRRKVDA